MFRREKDAFKVPKNAQQSLPIRTIFSDGIWLVGQKFSKSWTFTDINYAVASQDDQTEMFLGYCSLINALDTDAVTKITINNHRMNRADFERSTLIPLKQDGVDPLRQEANSILLDCAAGGNQITQQKIITVSAYKKSIEEARTFFTRVQAELTAHLTKLSSRVEPLDNTERLRVFHDFFRTGEEADYRFDIKDAMRKGRHFRDAVCPDSLSFKSDCFEMGGKFGRVLFLKEFPSFLKDSMVSELTDYSRNLMLSVDMVPIPTDEAVKEIENRLLGVDTDIARYHQRQSKNNNFSGTTPYQLEQMRSEIKEFLDDLTTRDQRMLFGLVTLVHVADTKEQLDNDTEALQAIARKNICQFTVLRYQQEDGLNTCLPYGLIRLHKKAMRTLTTEATAVLMPFKSQEIQHQGGVFYGVNAVSRNLILCDRRSLLNGNGFVLGVSGSGKSMFAKWEIAWLLMSSNCDVLVIDPENEFAPLSKAFGGEVVKVSANSPCRINAMDLSRDYGEGENPVALKSEYILSLCEQLVGIGKLDAIAKSIIDRCTAAVYRPYIQVGYEGQPPTLQDFYAELLRQPEPEARDIALAVELFTKGSLNIFAHQTNVNMDNRLVPFRI